ncbi:methyl-accepting chemotaxis protein [Candidatus Magnetaquicoccus inordinatus]|uniref:methyl-accepting chemotaxis protein n=1 Tax=Candidatus Magnetaquicoccus inordinatus TaxID=2496818 RepID=UPI00102C834A|nr:methyl-accepting chemotaxis protein [Candidatus Magnetaquicoccus inordinatus]
MNDATVLNREIQAEFGKGLDDIRSASSQMRSLIRDTVVKLDNSFNSLRRQAEQQQELVIGLASDLDEAPTDKEGKKKEHSNSANIQEFVKATDAILRTFVDRIAQISQESMRMVYRMDDVAAYMLRVQEHLSKINTVVELTKGLALNARIVAARAGRSGEAFTFVATEIHQLASSSRQVSDQISTAVEETNANIHSVRDIVKEMASKDMGFAMNAKGQVDTMMADISAINQYRAKTLRQVSGITEDIDDKVDLAVSLLRFEESVVPILKRIERKISALERFARLVDMEMILNETQPRRERLLKLQNALLQQQQSFDSASV